MKSERLIRWLRTFKKQKNKGYLIHGLHGCGKSTYIKESCKNTGYEVFLIDSTNINKDILLESTNNGNIKNKRYCVVIEDIETLSNLVKGFNTILANLLDPKKKPVNIRPIVISSLEKPWRQTQKLGKLCQVEKLYSFGIDEMKGIVDRRGLLNKENLHKLISLSGGDLVFVKNQLKFSGLIKTDNYEHTSKSVKKENIFNLYKRMVTRLNSFGKRITYDEIINDYFYDNFNIPNFVHENYPSNLNRQNWAKDASRIMDSVSEADVIDKKIKTDQNYKFLPYHGMLSTALPISIMSTRRNFTFPKMLQPYYPFFPTVMGKQSKMKGTRKKLKSYTSKKMFGIGKLDKLNLIKIQLGKTLDYLNRGIFKVNTTGFEDYDSFKFWCGFWKDTASKWKSVTRGTKIKTGKLWVKDEIKELTKRRKRRKKSKNSKRRNSSKKARVKRGKGTKRKVTVKNNRRVKKTERKFKKKSTEKSNKITNYFSNRQKSLTSQSNVSTNVKNSRKRKRKDKKEFENYRRKRKRITRS
jgi:Asp-tRNA(Asn)/Glu-tRNA(Gln) amidotransferase C subunit